MHTILFQSEEQPKSLTDKRSQSKVPNGSSSYKSPMLSQNENVMSGSETYFETGKTFNSSGPDSHTSWESKFGKNVSNEMILNGISFRSQE